MYGSLMRFSMGLMLACGMLSCSQFTPAVDGDPASAPIVQEIKAVEPMIPAPFNGYVDIGLKILTLGLGLYGSIKHHVGSDPVKV